MNTAEVESVARARALTPRRRQPDPNCFAANRGRKRTGTIEAIEHYPGPCRPPPPARRGSE